MPGYRNLDKRIKKIEKRQELKWHDEVIDLHFDDEGFSDALPDFYGFWLNRVEYGATENDRLGKDIHMTSVTISGTIQVPSSISTSNICRVMIVAEKSPSINGPAEADNPFNPNEVIDTNGTATPLYMGLYNPFFVPDDYKILMDEVFVINPDLALTTEDVTFPDPPNPDILGSAVRSVNPKPVYFKRKIDINRRSTYDIEEPEEELCLENKLWLFCVTDFPPRQVPPLDQPNIQCVTRVNYKDA